MMPSREGRKALPFAGVGKGFTLIELIIVIGVIIILAGAAVPSFGSTMARMRIQSNASQMVQDLRLVHDSAITYQQDLYVYICTSASTSATTYYYELSQHDPLHNTHYIPSDTPVPGKFVRKDLLYNMIFWPPVNSGAFTTIVGGKSYLVLAYCCGKGSNFRGQPVIVSDTSVPTYTPLTWGTIGIPIRDVASSRTWYVTVSPAGQASSSGVSP